MAAARSRGSALIAATRHSAPSQSWSSNPATYRRQASSSPRPNEEPSSSSSSSSTPSPRPRPRPRPQAERHRVQFNEDPFSLHPSEDHLTYPLVTANDLASAALSHTPSSTKPLRPREVRMLARDFIADSLYNPRYGYFSRRAALLPQKGDGASPGQGEGDAGGFAFGKMKDQRDFMAHVEERYNDFERSVTRAATSSHHRSTPSSASSPPPPSQRAATSPSSSSSSKPTKPISPSSAEGLEAAQALGRLAYTQSQLEDQSHDVGVQSMLARQVWHTPTTLFRPHYARIVAQHCLDVLADCVARGEPLVIHELGAGDGSLAADVMGYLEEKLPREVWGRVEYNVVEISERLKRGQEIRLARWVEEGKVRVHRRDFLEWQKREERECVVVALEVLDNLPHDVLRYSHSTLAPYQAHISIDSTGDFSELYTPATDPLITRYLSLLHTVRPSTLTRPPGVPPWLATLPAPLRKGLAEHFPLFPNLSKVPHFLPTGALRFVEVLASKFPRHHALVSDFYELPQAVRGVDGPVVQTRLAPNAGPMAGGGGRGNGSPSTDAATPVAVSTYAVLQGFFDIFFPTDFEVLRDVYSQVVNLAAEKPHQKQQQISRTPMVSSHRAFLERYPELARECALDGGKGANPMLEWYANVKWLTS